MAQAGARTRRGFTREAQMMDRLAELRERRALTLRELSEMSGVAADTINQIELGHRKARPSTLRKVAKTLDVEVADFFREPDTRLHKRNRLAGEVAGASVALIQAKQERIEHPMPSEEWAAASATVAIRLGEWHAAVGAYMEFLKEEGNE